MIKNCYHCGENLESTIISFDDHEFCCNGCVSVYRLLKENDLDNFYSFEHSPGIKPQEGQIHKYKFLDVPEIRRKHILFEDSEYVHINLYLPQIHCSSCIFLLENLERIVPEIINSQVDFTSKTATIITKKQLPLSELALTLDKIGYAPNFGGRQESERSFNKTLIIKLGIAGFAFGSIMLWTFPEYLGIAEDSPEFRIFPSILSFLVSIPVLLYSGSDYLISAYKSIRHKTINLDVPISIGIIALYSQSCYEIFTWNGPGYMDSFAGFIFFLLIGKWFQNKTYTSFRFDRDYKSYFPVASTRIIEGKEEIIEIEKIEEGDKLLIRNEEIIPCDSEVLEDQVLVDYSFVTGESVPVRIDTGEFLYAGGKLLGQKALIKALKSTDRSHLTQLWNNRGKQHKETSDKDNFSQVFLLIVLIIAIATGITWFWIDQSKVLHIVVSVLIVACPCALALSKPFTLGSIMRRLGNNGLYIKSSNVIESLKEVDTYVFDKTGTLTNTTNNHLQTKDCIDDKSIQHIYAVASNSNHPLSKSLVKYCLENFSNLKEYSIINFQEVKGKGLEAEVEGIKYKIGSADFTDQNREFSGLFITCNGKLLAHFNVISEFRNNLWKTLKSLSENGEVYILSGDKDSDLEVIKSNAPFVKNILFEQKPQDKKFFIESLQSKGKKVLMIGDGLNDAGALDVADVGIAVSDNVFHFTPGSDAIMDGKFLQNLNHYLSLARSSSFILKTCYVFSLLYNIIGLSFAVTGQLSPLIAAILMPLSSISIVLISTTLSRIKN